MACWLMPLLLMLSVMTYFFQSHNASTAARLLEQLDFNDQIVEERLNSAIAASRAASSEQKIRDAYIRYCDDERYGPLYSRCFDFMTLKYRHDEKFLASILWFYEDPEEMNVSVYNESIGASYHMVDDYWTEDHEAVYERAKNLDTGIDFFWRNDRLYMIRNIVTTRFEPIAAIVMQLNVDYCMGNLTTLPWVNSVNLYLEGNQIVMQGDKIKEDRLEMSLPANVKGYSNKEGSLWVYDSYLGDYHMSTLIEVKNFSEMGPFFGYQYVMLGMLLLLFPLMGIMMWLFRKQIAQPVDEMIDGAHHIEAGELGYKLEYQADNKEFQYLIDSFNAMSIQLEYQFEHIFEEELALRDARIKALQSNINPHFLNNTLEIINWEARLGGNIKVSKMIEALSVLLDGAMDRKGKPEVRLAEEMVYVNAYLYIVQERLGKRVTIVKDLDESLMEYMVPRLIMQPVIENAVEHGVVPYGRGIIGIHGFVDGDMLIIQIINDGTLSEEDEKHIALLLSPEYDKSRESSGNLGIANVNQRLRIMYGDPCRLTLEKDESNHTIATIRIKISQNEQKNTTNSITSYSNFPGEER